MNIARDGPRGGPRRGRPCYRLRGAHLSKTAKGAAASGVVAPAEKSKVGQPPGAFAEGAVEPEVPPSAWRMAPFETTTLNRPAPVPNLAALAAANVTPGYPFRRIRAEGAASKWARDAPRTPSIQGLVE